MLTDSELMAPESEDFIPIEIDEPPRKRCIIVIIVIKNQNKHFTHKLQITNSIS